MKKLYNTLLASVMTISLITSLSSCIDEDMSDCGKEYKIQYNLRLNTQINTVIDVDLNLIEEQEIAARLKQALSKVFTDHAHDNDLSFFVGEELSHHETNKMGANSVSYTIYLPRNNYQNLSLANTGSADNVKIINANSCRSLALRQEAKDTINSHNIGLFTSRLAIDENDFEHDLQTTLYMANSSAVVVFQPQHDGQGKENQPGFHHQLHSNPRCPLHSQLPEHQTGMALPRHHQGERQIHRNHLHHERTAESRQA